MKLISSTQMSWNEPLFFLIRLRERGGWLRRGALAIGIIAVMFLAIHVTRNPPIGIGKAIGISLVAGIFLVALLDVGSIQREVTIKEDSIIYNSAVGAHWMGSFALKDIQGVRLLRPHEWKWPFGAMFIQSSDDVFLLGVPNKVSLDKIANVLHRLGLVVVLDGWAPSETDTRVQVKDEVILPKETARLFSQARIWPVDPQEERLSPPLATTTAIVIALGPLFLSLLGLIAAGIYLFLKWGTLAAISKWMIGGGVLVAVVVSFLYLLLAGQFLAARYSIGIAKGIMSTRRNSQFSGREEDLIPIEIFDRTAWTSAVARSVEFGFLQIDSGRGVLKFEGDKNRWDIPLTALTACRVEEAQVGSEGNQNAEKRYYIVIALHRDGQPWEAGMVHTRTQLGNNGREQRYARAQALFGRISAVVSPT